MALPTAPTVATGNRLTNAGIQSARRIVEMAPVIYGYDQAGDTPFLTVLQNRLQTQVTGNPKFQHLEDAPLPRITTTASSYAAGTETTIAVAAGTGAYFRAGDLVLFPTAVGIAAPGEIVYVSSVATDNLTVIRDYNNTGTTGGATTSGDHIQIIGNTNVEFGTLRSIKTTTEAVVTNYCGIVRTPYGVSNTLGGSNLYGGNDLDYQRVKGAREHRLELESQFLFGKPFEQSTTARGTGGLLYWIATNKTNASGTLTPNTLEKFAASIFRYSMNDKLLMCSRTVMTQLDLIAEGRIETSVGADTYGVALRRYVTGHGNLNICIHDMLVQDYVGYAIAVDMDKVKVRFMNDARGGARNALLETNRQANDADGVIEEYLSEVGLHVIQEATHGVLYGVS